MQYFVQEIDYISMCVSSRTVPKASVAHVSPASKGALILDKEMVGQVYVKQVWIGVLIEQLSVAADFRE